SLLVRAHASGCGVALGGLRVAGSFFVRLLVVSGIIGGHVAVFVARRVGIGALAGRFGIRRVDGSVARGSLRDRLLGARDLRVDGTVDGGALFALAESLVTAHVVKLLDRTVRTPQIRPISSHDPMTVRRSDDSPRRAGWRPRSRGAYTPSRRGHHLAGRVERRRSTTGVRESRAQRSRAARRPSNLIRIMPAQEGRILCPYPCAHRRPPPRRREGADSRGESSTSSW